MKFYFYYGRLEIAIHIDVEGILLTLSRKANKFPGEEEKWKGSRKENRAMKTQEIAILDFGLGLDDEIGYEDRVMDTNYVCNGCVDYKCNEFQCFCPPKS